MRLTLEQGCKIGIGKCLNRPEMAGDRQHLRSWSFQVHQASECTWGCWTRLWHWDHVLTVHPDSSKLFLFLQNDSCYFDVDAPVKIGHIKVTNCLQLSSYMWNTIKANSLNVSCDHPSCCKYVEHPSIECYRNIMLKMRPREDNCKFLFLSVIFTLGLTSQLYHVVALLAGSTGVIGNT